jgi:hypothetical protein
MSTMNLCLLVLSAAVAAAHIYLRHHEHEDHTPQPSRRSIPMPRNSSAHL